MLNFIKSTALKVIILILIVLGISFVVFFPQKVRTAWKVTKSFYKVYQGDKKYRSHDLTGAINYYNEALVLYPQHPKASYNLGNIYAVYEDYNSALGAYEHSLKYNPKYMTARIALGILLSEKFFDYDRAIKEYQTTIDDAPFYINIPMLYNNKEYVIYNKSTAFYNMGLAYKWKSLLNSENLLAVRKNLQQSVEVYKKSIELMKNNYNAYFNLALSLQLLGESTEAKAFYCKCIEMRPFDYDAHYNMAVLLREENNYLDAILELEKAALIVDSAGDGFKTRYIYDVLSETSKKLYAQQDYKELIEKLNNDPIRRYEPTFVNGKIVASEELDRAMLENMRTCSYKKE
ncbi:MAG: tetratricopeptide repeat protein [Candidatus Gastranaerophilales bacterium]|nr:tetratricopeptide repeat protein [Candidatus Gastranaerophilales bacterium]